MSFLSICDSFRVDLQNAIDVRVHAPARIMTRYERDAIAIVCRSENFRARATDTALLLPEKTADRIHKAERHLQSMFTSTLHDLERLQRRRAGEQVMPPVVADCQIVISSESQ